MAPPAAPIRVDLRLSYEQSADLLKLDPAAIGYDPTILLYDLYACPGTGTGAYRGFRLNLGLMRPPSKHSPASRSLPVSSPRSGTASSSTGRSGASCTARGSTGSSGCSASRRVSCC